MADLTLFTDAYYARRGTNAEYEEEWDVELDPIPEGQIVVVKYVSALYHHGEFATPEKPLGIGGVARAVRLCIQRSDGNAYSIAEEPYLHSGKSLDRYTFAILQEGDWISVVYGYVPLMASTDLQAWGYILSL